MLHSSIFLILALVRTALTAFPNVTFCRDRNWDLGDEPDPDTPRGSIPVPGQQVYIKDAVKNLFYDHGLLPNIVQGEGYVQSYCMGSYLSPGSLPIANGGIRSAHVTRNFTNDGANYVQIYGTMDCMALNINCTMSEKGAYDDGGQYDAVPYRKCGKEPYSGVDPSKHDSSFLQYLEQAGDGLYCMRVCQGGTSDGDPCNAKVIKNLERHNAIF
ncbi:UNVERIFIED_CONTAM: hypothetical protein HDU68_010236 [Siphonaria sp. JEL0065]|nr:hypothetical protein HDU68_010236 [Siphonaria sp. JEL0065]